MEGQWRLLRYQVLLALLTLQVLDLRTGHVDLCGVGAIVQEVVERIQVVRLRRGRKGGDKGDRLSGLTQQTHTHTHMLRRNVTVEPESDEKVRK